MDKIIDYISLQTIVGEIRSKSPLFVTNYFPNETKDKELIAKEQLYYYRNEDVCLVIRQFVGYNDFSYIASSLETLYSILEDFFSSTHDIYVTDLVGFPAQIASIKLLFGCR